MADDTTRKSLDFGISQTAEISSDDMFASMESITADPDKVKDVNLPEVKKKEPAKAPAKDKEKEKDKEDEDEPIGGENDDILNFDEEENKDTKKKASKEDEEEEGKQPEDKEDKQPEDEDEENSFTSISKELFKLGVFTKGEDEDEPEVTTGEELLDLFVNEKKKGAVDILEGILSRHGQDKRDLFDAVILKGVSPKDYLQKYTEIEDLRAVDLADTNMQERVMREELKAQGWDKEDIDTEIEKVKEYGDLETASKRYHKSLIKRTEAQLNADKEQRENELAADQQRDEEYKSNITAIVNAKLKDKDFDGIPFTQDIASKTLDSIYTKKWKLPSGETITDFDNFILRLKRPENHALKVKMGLLVEMLKVDPTLSLIKKKAVSNESNEVFKTLDKKTTKKADITTRKPQATTSSWFT